MRKNPTLEQAAQGYVEAHAGSFHPISISEALKALRGLVLATEHTDAEIAEVVATAAVRVGATVHFDGASNRQADT